MFTLLCIIQAHATEFEKITLQLRWKHQFQFAGFYIAKEHGYFQETGLDVTIKEYAHPINVVEDVLSGKANYGVGRSSLLIERAQGKPVVALGAIYQSSPSILLSTNPAVKSLKDLRGKKVMITDDTAQSAAITSMLLSNGLNKDDFIQQEHSFNYRDLIEGNTDAMASYLSNEPFLLALNKIPYKFFDPKDYGYDFYGDIIFTSENEMKKHPQRVRAFYSAVIKGWLWAFNNIEETANLIYKKYNSQNKSVESLIYEGATLKGLALVEGLPFGHISKNKFSEIANVYRLSNLLEDNYSLDEFIDPLDLNKTTVKIGVLAKRGYTATIARWQPLAKHLNKTLETYRFAIIPLDFSQLKQSVANKKIDFIITNTMYYVQLEHQYGISRIATLLNQYSKKEQQLREFGGVIFTRRDNQKINHIRDLKNKSFAAVNERSFGGWVMAYEELMQQGIKRTDIKLSFLNTHDAVVNSVINGRIQAGTVRTDTLENMAQENKIDLSLIKVINPQTFKNFPYLVSTRLYPEWPFAKLKHTADTLANSVVSELVNIAPNSKVARAIKTGGWTVPLDYSPVHSVLKKLQLPPYDYLDIRLSDVLRQYAWLIYATLLIFIFLILRLYFVRKHNKYLDQYNLKLDQEVKKRTQQLEQANQELKVISQTDPLTGISNRGYFMEMSKKYLNIATRNRTPLQFLLLDLDDFKHINDSYGHQTGDRVLKEFTRTINTLLRESDLFGRVGGEEFALLLQNTSLHGAMVFAERVRKGIASMPIRYEDKMLNVTVSIGLAELKDEIKIEELLRHSDIALYKAKNGGKNQTVNFTG